MSQAPPRQKTTAPASSQSSGNMTARRKQGSNLQFEAMKSTAIPSLFDICAKLLQTHVDSLPILDNVEDAIIQRILSACDATKLDEIESKNEQAGIELNTDDLWRILTIRDFGGACADKGNGTWKELYNKLNQEKMAREKKLREIKESNKVEKKGSRIISGSSTTSTGVNNKNDKHTTQTIDPVISRRAASNTIRNSSGSRSRSSSSSSSRSRNTSNTATTAPKKSKLWTKSLGETSTSRKTKESTTTSAPQKIFKPGKPASIVTTDFNADRYKSNYAKPSIGNLSTTHIPPVVMKQPVYRAASNIDFTRQRPSSPPTSDSIATDSPIVTPSYVDSMFGKETSKRMEKLKRQTENDSVRRQLNAPSKSNSTSTVPSKQQRPPPSSHNSSSLAPPQKKVKPTEQSSSHSNVASDSFNFTIPRKKK